VHSAKSTPIERYGDGANPNQIGTEAAADALAGLVASVLQDGSAAHVALCAGVAGAGRADEQQALAEALRAALGRPDRSVRVEVVSDAQIALDAAYDTESGVIVIAGTGSMVLGRTTDDTLLRAGGWGHVLGDAGSGHALGRTGLRAVAEAFDGGTETTLRARLRDHFDIHDRDDLLTAVYQSGFDVASVAPLVLDAAAEGDAVATRLLTTQVAGLAEQAAWLLGRDASLAPRLTLVGGLTQNDHYAHHLRRALAERVPDATVERLRDAPVAGALRRARRLQAE
jgi:N-acetylglucosamine kinase-like BadF-type ATPase